jgi:gamma-glutamyl:cysteine ligase YbdK (ATP-grasp superfamily)
MYNNETDLEELYEQIEASRPKLNLSQQARDLRSLLRKEKSNIQRLKHRMKESKVREGEISMSVKSMLENLPG